MELEPPDNMPTPPGEEHELIPFPKKLSQYRVGRPIIELRKGVVITSEELELILKILPNAMIYSRIVSDFPNSQNNASTLPEDR